LPPHVDHRERSDELARADLFDGRAVLGKMQRCVEMRTGVFDDPPPIQVEAVLLELVLLLNLDSRHAKESRKVRRHGVGEIDHRPELAGRGLRRRHRGRGEARGRGACKKASPAERASHRFLTSGNAHGRPPWLKPGATHASSVTGSIAPQASAVQQPRPDRGDCPVP
jgi:hypothetical protein